MCVGGESREGEHRFESVGRQRVQRETRMGVHHLQTNRCCGEPLTRDVRQRSCFAAHEPETGGYYVRPFYDWTGGLRICQVYKCATWGTWKMGRVVECVERGRQGDRETGRERGSSRVQRVQRVQRERVWRVDRT